MHSATPALPTLPKSSQGGRRSKPDSQPSYPSPPATASSAAWQTSTLGSTLGGTRRGARSTPASSSAAAHLMSSTGGGASEALSTSRATTAVGGSRGQQQQTKGGGGGNTEVGLRKRSDPLSTLRECIEAFLAQPTVFGAVPSLLLNTYRAVVEERCELAEEGRAIVPPNMFERAIGETGLLADLRHSQAREERLKKTSDMLHQQNELMQLQLREREVDAQKAERLQTEAEAHEGELRLKMQQLQTQNTALQGEAAALKLQVTRAQGTLQSLRAHDEQRAVERTADLRQELSRQYEIARSLEETVKSCDREINGLTSERDHLELKLNATQRELEDALDTIQHKEDAAKRMQEQLEERAKQVAARDSTISDLHLLTGATMVRQRMVKENKAWGVYEKVVEAEREDCASATAPSAKPIKAQGMGQAVPPHLRYPGKIRPKALKRQEAVLLAVASLTDLYDPAADAAGIESYETPAVLVSEISSFSQRLHEWLKRLGGDKKVAAELAYGLQAAVARHSELDADLRLLSEVLEERIPLQCAVFSVYGAVQELYELLASEDVRRMNAEGGAPQRSLPVTAVHGILKTFAAHPEHSVDPRDVDRLVFLLSMDYNTPYVPYRTLFEVNEEGLRSNFLGGLIEILVNSCIDYYASLRALATQESVDKQQPQQQHARHSSVSAHDGGPSTTDNNSSTLAAAPSAAGGGSRAGSRRPSRAGTPVPPPVLVVPLQSFIDEWTAMDAARLADGPAIRDLIASAAEQLAAAASPRAETNNPSTRPSSKSSHQAGAAAAGADIYVPLDQLLKFLGRIFVRRGSPIGPSQIVRQLQEDAEAVEMEASSRRGGAPLPSMAQMAPHQYSVVKVTLSALAKRDNASLPHSLLMRVHQLSAAVGRKHSIHIKAARSTVAAAVAAGTGNTDGGGDSVVVASGVEQQEQQPDRPQGSPRVATINFLPCVPHVDETGEDDADLPLAASSLRSQQPDGEK